MRVRQRIRPIRAAWAPSRVRRLIRDRRTQAAALIVAAALIALSLEARLEAAETERAAWGETTTVVVVVDAVAVGDPLGPAVVARDLPVGLVPASALFEVPDGSLAKVALYPGEVVLRDRVTRTGSEHPPSTAALTLSVVAQLPMIAVGDLVDLWVVDSANLSSRRVAERVVVLAFSDRTITVAVPDAQVADAAVASLRPIAVALVG